MSISFDDNYCTTITIAPRAFVSGQTKKTSKIFKNMIYISFLQQRRLCVVGIQSEWVRTYLSSVAGTFLWSSATAGEHTRSWLVCLSDQWVSPFAWETSGPLSSSFEWPLDFCLQSKITGLILSFQVPCWSMNILFAPHIFCLWLVIGTYILPFLFFRNLLIWSANGNICYSIHRQ